MEMFMVEVENQGTTFWLGGTVWRFAKERGGKYESIREAHAALDKAKPFMTAAIYRRAKVVPA